MLTAIRNRDNQKVIAPYEDKDKQGYRCQNCSEAVILNKGKVRCDYFRHHTLSNCANKGESVLHMKIKQIIYEQLISIFKSIKWIDLEYPIGNDLRSDIYLQTGKGTKIALEIQVSPITVKELYRRTSLYHENAINVLWILPFEKERFYPYWTAKEREMAGYRSEEGNYKRSEIKFKEYELAIAKLTFNYLTFWDLTKEYSTSFLVMKLGKVYGEDSDFYDSSGDQVSFEGKLKKTIKSTKEFRNVTLNEFVPQEVAIYERGQLYEIPARHIMGFNEKRG